LHAYLYYCHRGDYQFDHSYFGQVVQPKVEGYDETDSNNYRRNSAGLKRRRKEIMKFGYPSLDNIKYKDNYVLSYNRRLRQANWVCEVHNYDVDDLSSISKQLIIALLIPSLCAVVPALLRSSGSCQGCCDSAHSWYM
jgi:hypothetical protein